MWRSSFIGLQFREMPFTGLMWLRPGLGLRFLSEDVERSELKLEVGASEAGIAVRIAGLGLEPSRNIHRPGFVVA